MIHAVHVLSVLSSKISDVITGVPVATVGINNSINAILLAVRILGAFDAKIREKVEGTGLGDVL